MALAWSRSSDGQFPVSAARSARDVGVAGRPQPEPPSTAQATLLAVARGSRIGLSRSSPDLSQKASWNAGQNRIFRHIPRHDGAGADQRACADRHAAHDHRPRSDRSAFLHDRRSRSAPHVGCTRFEVVDEHHAMTDEDVVLERHAFAQEAVRRNLAASPDAYIPLYLSEGSDARLRTYYASVQIHELRVINHNV